jgi:hypothetical protein
MGGNVPYATLSDSIHPNVTNSQCLASVVREVSSAERSWGRSLFVMRSPTWPKSQLRADKARLALSEGACVAANPDEQEAAHVIYGSPPDPRRFHAAHPSIGTQRDRIIDIEMLADDMVNKEIADHPCSRRAPFHTLRGLYLRLQLKWTPNLGPVVKV